MLLGLGLYGIAFGGVSPLPLALTSAGLALAAVSLLDYPRHTHFGPDGIARACFLRRHHLPWSSVTALERAAASRLAMRRSLLAGGQHDREARTSRYGGLVARGHGKRRYLLADRVESRAEYDRLARLVAQWAPEVQVRAARPPESAAPSDLYRRRQTRVP